MALNGLLRFLLLGCGLGAFAYLGVRAGGSLVADVLLAFVFPAAVALLWVLVVAPRSPSQLTDDGRSLGEVFLLSLAALALAASGLIPVAIAFFVLTIFNTGLSRYVARRVYETDPLRGLYPGGR